MIALLYNTEVYSQTNLICNPSFEDVNADALNRLNDANTWHPTHFYDWGDSYPNYPSLFNCWDIDVDHALIGSALHILGISYGITPGLFPTSDGATQNYYASSLNSPYVTTDVEGNLRAFKGDDLPSGLILSTNSNGLNGLDLSPPNTKFGENVSATEGNSYVALFDFENDKWDVVPSLFTELKFPLQKDVNYTFSMDFCKMNLLGYIKDLEGWDNVEDGKIEVYISYDEAPISPRQKICEIDATDNAWDVTTWDFKAERSYTHLLIEFDPIKGQIFAPTKSKIGGVFIDNLKLYESCETAENQCENANYKRDLLDARLEQVQMHSPLALPDDVGFDDGEFKTVRAYHLENAKHIHVKISPENSTTACYEFDMWYPPSDWFWDGKNYNGHPMDEGGYDAVLTVSNDCFDVVDEINFPLKRNYSVFEPSISTNAEDGNSFINGLANVQFVTVRIYTLSGDLIHQFSLDDPPSSLGLSINSLYHYGGAQNGEVATGVYTIQLYVSNNCSEMNYTFSGVTIGNIIDGTDVSPFYNWESAEKPNFQCPFDFHYNQFVRSPMNCCEGYLILENVEIWNSWGEVNIQGNIYLGPNVVFEEGTLNQLNSGAQIILVPDETGVIVNDGTILKPQTFNCQNCKSYTFESTDDYIGDLEDLGKEISFLQLDSLDEEAKKEMIVFPNPASTEQELTIKAGNEPIEPSNYRLSLFNSIGSAIPIKIISVTERMLRFKGVTPLMAGAYYLSYESNGVQKTFNLIIK